MASALADLFDNFAESDPASRASSPSTGLLTADAVRMEGAGDAAAAPNLGAAASPAAATGPTLAPTASAGPPLPSNPSVPMPQDDITELRRNIVTTIIGMLEKKKPDAPEAWKQRLPDMATRLEQTLYRESSSLADYANRDTLKNRLHQLAIRIRNARQEHRRQRTNGDGADGSVGGSSSPGPNSELAAATMLQQSHQQHPQHLQQAQQAQRAQPAQQAALASVSVNWYPLHLVGVSTTTTK
mmetsp:Transcript_73158/g.208456  ORF Transcript_73158/g.208456 Transcript_73158/m.208456 type:complete len:242 (+) Transcript_73158:211-936(+)